jgi:hypothetical protein
MGSYHDHYGNRRKAPGARFTVGRDHHGWWVVHDRLDRVGGYFLNEDAARHFAAEEAGNDTSDISIVGAEAEVELFPETADRPSSIGRDILDNNRRLEIGRRASRQR